MALALTLQHHLVSNLLPDTADTWKLIHRYMTSSNTRKAAYSCASMACLAYVLHHKLSYIDAGAIF